MIDLRRRDGLGSTQAESFTARHHFSFAAYQDLDRTCWGDLCCVNHDILAPRAELSPQPIDHAEIVTLVRDGVVAHAGTLGGRSRTAAGEVQLISSGDGMTHGHINPGNRPAEYLEIRIATSRGGTPHRRLTKFPKRSQAGRFVTLASGFAEDRDALAMQAQARVVAARLRAGRSLRYRLAPGRHAYVVALSGEVVVGGIVLQSASGAAIRDEPTIRFDGIGGSDLVLIDTN